MEKKINKKPKFPEHQEHRCRDKDCKFCSENELIDGIVKKIKHLEFMIEKLGIELEKRIKRIEDFAKDSLNEQ